MWRSWRRESGDWGLGKGVGCGREGVNVNEIAEEGFVKRVFEEKEWGKGIGEGNFRKGNWRRGLKKRVREV